MYHRTVLYESKSKPIELFQKRVVRAIPHIHKEIEIVYVLEGHLKAYADEYQYDLSEGDLFISFPNQIHSYGECAEGKYDVLILSPDLFLGLGKVLKNHVPVCNRVQAGEDNLISELMEKTYQMHEELQRPLYYMTALNGYVNLLLSDIMSRVELKPFASADNSALRNVIDYCFHHFNEVLSLDILAKELHFNKYYISRLLNQGLGMNFDEYINTLRIDVARELLDNTDKKIVDISEEVGYGSIRSFNRAFKQQMHVTPTEYRMRR